MKEDDRHLSPASATELWNLRFLFSGSVCGGRRGGGGGGAELDLGALAEGGCRGASAGSGRP